MFSVYDINEFKGLCVGFYVGPASPTLQVQFKVTKIKDSYFQVHENIVMNIFDWTFEAEISLSTEKQSTIFNLTTFFMQKRLLHFFVLFILLLIVNFLTFYEHHRESATRIFVNRSSTPAQFDAFLPFLSQESISVWCERYR